MLQMAETKIVLLLRCSIHRPLYRLRPDKTGILEEQVRGGAA